MCNFFHILGLSTHEQNFTKSMNFELWPGGNLKDSNGKRSIPLNDKISIIIKFSIIVEYLVLFGIFFPRLIAIQCHLYLPACRSEGTKGLLTPDPSSFITARPECSTRAKTCIAEEG